MKMQELQIMIVVVGLFWAGMADPKVSHVALMTDAQAMTSSEQMLVSFADEARIEVSASSVLRNSLVSASAAYSDVEADSQMGSDLGLDYALDTRIAGKSDSGPKSLKDYCAGKGSEGDDVGEGMKVKANWEGYGTKYKGKVTDVNEDGSVDVHYNDGFTEKNVKMDDVRIRKKQPEGVGGEAKKPLDDPACQFPILVGNISDKLVKVQGAISTWMAAQRAKIIGDQKPAQPAKLLTMGAAPAPASKGAPAAADENEDLAKLKEQLAEKEETIKELEKEWEENNKELKKSQPKSATKEASAVDDLIAKYKDKIAKRDSRISELKDLIREQEEELEKIAAAQLSLADIEADIVDLEQDIADGKKKRDELEKDGKLDPELATVLDGIIKSGLKLRVKIDNLIALEEKAKADREEAERKADEAAAAARKKAKEEGKDEDEAAAAAMEKANSENKDAVAKADAETMKAAQEVADEMKETEKNAKQLDTGLHPHGKKWWRYRYERSYIEALLMIFISFLMVFWSKTMDFLRQNVNDWAQPASTVGVPSEEEQSSAETHGAIFKLWLHLLAEQMMVCILVFLTVWLVAKTSLAEIFPLLIKPTDDMRVPSTGEEYRDIGLDICTIFFFAILFYFCIMFAVANDTWAMTQKMEEFEVKGVDYHKADHDAGRRHSMFQAMDIAAHEISEKSMGCIAACPEDYAVVKRHFIKHMNHAMVHSDDPTHKEISRLLGDDLNKFPLWKYLKFNVRGGVIRLFRFGWEMWTPVICLFVCLMLLHRFAHLGYVRIMGVFAMITLAIIMSIGFYVKSMSREIQKNEEPEAGPLKKTIFTEYQTEQIALDLLQFSMFFVCYGVARMICQPWMWELHFWPVLTLTIVALISACLFVVMVAPAIPSFCALQAVPPYVDHENLATMLRIADGVSKGSSTGAARV